MAASTLHKLKKLSRFRNNLLAGPEKVSGKEAKRIVQEVAGGKVDVRVSSSKLPSFNPVLGATTTRSPVVAAHEGRHAWQHKKGVYVPALVAGKATETASGAVGLKSALWDNPNEHSTAKSKSVGLRAASTLPGLALEADANIATLKRRGGLRSVPGSMGSHLLGSATKPLNTHLTIGAMRALRRQLPWHKRAAAAAKLKAASNDKKYALQYANKPITKPGVKLLGKRNGELPETWVQDYEDTLRAMSKLDLNKPGDAARAAELEGFLGKLETQAKRAGRGGLFKPAPGVMKIYPDMSELPHEAIKRAVRANTSSDVRKTSWNQVQQSAKAFKPVRGESSRDKQRTGMDTLQQRSFMEAAAVSLPIGKGREPGLLGQKVPGEFTMGPTGTRSIQGRGAFSSSDWARGFSPMKFAAAASPKSWGAAKILKTVAMSSLAIPAMGTPGYLTGFHRGKKRGDLSPEQLATRRLWPGYTEGYVQGKILNKPKARASAKFSLSSAAERYYYEAGFMQGMRDKWGSFKKRLEGNVLPTIARGAVIGGLGKLHQETGLLPPTTVDGIPVTRRSMDSSFGPYSTAQLGSTLKRLKTKEAQGTTGAGSDSVDSLIKSLEEEILLRRGLPSV